MMSDADVSGQAERLIRATLVAEMSGACLEAFPDCEPPDDLREIMDKCCQAEDRAIDHGVGTVMRMLQRHGFKISRSE
jgi:hypothetical protein